MEATGGQPFVIRCNTTESRPIVWLRTINETGVFTVANSSRVYITDNGLALNFAIVQLFDQEFYACAFADSAGTFNVVQSFYLYVKVFPVLTFVVGTTIFNASDTIIFNAPGTYQLACLSVQSKPEVELSIFDSNRFLPLGNSANSQTTRSCGPNNLCDVIYQVSLELSAGSPFLTMSSLTCMAKSLLSQVNLDTSISRNVRVLFENQSIGKLAYVLNTTTIYFSCISVNDHVFFNFSSIFELVNGYSDSPSWLYYILQHDNQRPNHLV